LQENSAEKMMQQKESGKNCAAKLEQQKYCPPANNIAGKCKFMSTRSNGGGFSFCLICSQVVDSFSVYVTPPPLFFICHVTDCVVERIGTS